MSTQNLKKGIQPLNKVLFYIKPTNEIVEHLIILKLKIYRSFHTRSTALQISHLFIYINFQWYIALLTTVKCIDYNQTFNFRIFRGSIATTAQSTATTTNAAITIKKNFSISIVNKI